MSGVSIPLERPEWQAISVTGTDIGANSVTETKRYDLFISYVPADEAWVQGYLLDLLREADVAVQTEEAFRLGVPRLLEFERAVEQSRRTLLVLSPAYLADDYSQFVEVLAASYGQETATWPVIPLLLHPVDLPPRLRMLAGLDATDAEQWPAVNARLLDELQRPVPGPPPQPACPYPGMEPFSEADSARFYGRDVEIQGLLNDLRGHPFVTVIGPSGSGKSSLVFAGFLPALRQSGLFGPGRWTLRDLRPGETPLATLANALGVETADLTQATQDGLPISSSERLLLIVDQFEELFILSPASQIEPFQQALRRLIRMDNVYVLLTVRADFYPDLMGSPLWTQIEAHRLEVLPLKEEGLRQVIVRPAEDVGVFVEPALVERLVADAAGEPGVLPFVQETLVLLWEHLERRFLPLRAYELLVLSRRAYDRLDDGELTGLQVAIAQHADQTLDDLSPNAQTIARRIFLRLVQFGEGRADTRRQQTIAALRAGTTETDLFDQTLQHLAENRLLTLSGEAGRPSDRAAASRRPDDEARKDEQSKDEQSKDEQRKVDIAHEALISGWPRLRQWIREGRAAEVVRRQVEQAADEWRRRQDNSYLWQGRRLAQAQEWVAEAPGKSSDEVQAFLRASQRYDNLFRYARWFGLVVLILLAAIPPFQWGRDYLRRQAAQAPTVRFETSNALLGWDGGAARVNPARRVTVAAFSLDRHEVSYGQYRRCLQAGRCSLPLEPLDAVSSIEYADDRWPVVWVTGYQAAQFCTWLGGRLPTEVEWERAARGTDGRRWPRSNDPPQPGQANVNLTNAPQQMPSGPVAVDDVSFSDDVTPEGVLHLLGNVQEWTGTPAACQDDPYGCDVVWDNQEKVQALFVRGWAWNDNLDPTRDEQALTDALDLWPIEARENVGFRCAYSD